MLNNINKSNNINNNDPSNNSVSIFIPMSLWLHAIAFLANAMAHRRIANDILEYNGIEIIQLLGKSNHLSLFQSELSICLHSLSSHDSAMERIIRSSDDFEIVFQLSLQLLRSSDEYTYRYALLFFIESFAFPPFLNAFDQVGDVCYHFYPIIVTNIIPAYNSILNVHSFMHTVHNMYVGGWDLSAAEHTARIPVCCRLLLGRRTTQTNHTHPEGGGNGYHALRQVCVCFCLCTFVCVHVRVCVWMLVMGTFILSSSDNL